MTCQHGNPILNQTLCHGHDIPPHITPAPDGEWLDLDGALQDLGNSYVAGRLKRARFCIEAKAAILQEIQNHDRQLLESVELALPEKRHTWDFPNELTTEERIIAANAFNEALKQMKSILNAEREGL